LKGGCDAAGSPSKGDGGDWGLSCGETGCSYVESSCDESEGADAWRGLAGTVGDQSCGLGDNLCYRGAFAVRSSNLPMEARDCNRGKFVGGMNLHKVCICISTLANSVFLVSGVTIVDSVEIIGLH
jgi:hypothetical protein